MKTKFETLFPLLTAAITETLVLGQSFQPLLGPDNYPAVGVGKDVLIAPFSASTLFLAAQSTSSDQRITIWRVTSPSDSPEPPFSSIAAPEPLDSSLSVVHRLHYSPDYGLMAVGSNAGLWRVLNSVNEGDTWTDFDGGNGSFQFSDKRSAYPSEATGIATDPDGRVYVCGVANDGRINHWIILRRLSNGAWDKVYDATSKAGSCRPYAMCYVQAGPHSTAAVFAVGILNDKWTVLRSRNSGDLGSWSPVDPWPADGSIASAYDIASDSDGRVYVVGVRGKDGDNRGWVIRLSIDGGQNWLRNPVLDKADGPSSWAARVAVDGEHNVWVAGAIQTPATSRNGIGSPRWTVVRNTPGQLWVDSIDGSDSWSRRVQPLGSNVPSRGRGIAFDLSGDPLLTGDIQISGGAGTINVIGLVRGTR